MMKPRFNGTVTDWRSTISAPRTMYRGIENEKARLMTECGKPRGEFRFMLIRGKEFPGRV